MLELVVVFVMADPLAVSAKTATKLHTVVDVKFPSQPVGKLIRDFAAKHELNLVVDPRIDTSKDAGGQFHKTPVEQVISNAAGFANARMIVVGDVVVISTVEHADRWAAAAVLARDRVAQLPPVVRERLFARGSLKLNSEDSLESTAARWASQLGLAFENPGELDIPGPSIDIQDVQMVDQISLVAGLADRCWSLDPEGKKIHLAEFPEDVRLTRTVRTAGSTEAKQRKEMYEKLKIPDLVVTTRGSSLVLKGAWTSLWQAERIDRARRSAVREAKAGKTPKSKGKESRRFDVQFRNLPLEDFAKAVYEKVKIPIEIDDESLSAAGRTRRDPVNCVATRVTVEELLEIALDEAGFAFEMSETKIVIRAIKN
jgi:hypothetical protein